MKDFMTSIERSGYVPKELAPYETNDPFGVRLRKEAIAVGANKLLIPVEYLQGTQDATGYGSNKAKRAEKALAANGMEFLKQYPIIATAVFKNGNTDIYIEDGHHRTYKSPKFGIRSIPTFLLTIEQMSQIRKNMNRTPDQPEEISKELLMESIAAQDTLGKKGVSKFGKRIDGIGSLDELKVKFPGF